MQSYTSKAFLSYSHHADSTLAAELQYALQRFAKRYYALRALHIFRDKTDLSVNPGLWSSIAAALDSSEYFLLLASPKAAQSRWVKREIDHWLDRHEGSTKKMLLLWTGGDLVWDERAADFDWEKTDALPVLLDWRGAGSATWLAGCFGEEPFFIDLRWTREESDLSIRNPAFLDAVATIAAKLRGEPKSTLISREVTEFRRFRRLRAGAITALVAFAIVAGTFGTIAMSRQREAVRARGLAEERLIEANEARDDATRAAKNEATQRGIADRAAEQEKQARLGESAARAEAERRQVEAERQADIALGRQLAAQSESTRENPRNLTLATLLAAQAVQRLDLRSIGSFEADLALRRSLEMLPKPIRRFPAGQVSPDGRYVVFWNGSDWEAATASAGQTLFHIPVRSATAKVLFNFKSDICAVVDGRRVVVSALPSGPFLEGSVPAQPQEKTDPMEQGETREVVFGPNLERADEPVALSESGRYLVTMTTWSWTVLDDDTPGEVTVIRNKLAVYDFATSRTVRTFELGDDIRFAVWYEMDRTARMAFVSRKVSWGGLHYWTDVLTLEPLTTDAEDDFKTSAVLGPSRYAAEWLNLTLRSALGAGALVEISPGRTITSIVSRYVNRADPTSTKLRESPNARFAVLSKRDSVVVFKPDGGAAPLSSTQPDEYAAAIDDDGRNVALAGPANTVRVVDATTGKELNRTAYEGKLQRVYLTPSGECRLLTEDAQGTLTSYLADGVRPGVEKVTDGAAVIRRAGEPIKGEAVGRSVVMLDTGNVVKLPETARKTPGTDNAFAGPVSAALTSDGRYLAANYFGDVVGIWEVASGKLLNTLRREKTTGQSAKGVVLSFDGRHVVGTGSTAHVWTDFTTPNPRDILLPVDDPSFPQFDPEGRFLAIVQQNQGISIFSCCDFARTAALERTEKGHVSMIALSSGARRAVTVFDEGAAGSDPGKAEHWVESWDVARRTRVARWSHAAPSNQILSMDLTRDGNYVVTSGSDRTVRIWDASSGAELTRVLLEQAAPDVVFSHDERKIVARTGPDPWTPSPPSGMYQRVSRVGEETLSGELAGEREPVPDDRRIMRWLWRPRDLLGEVCARLGTDLTSAEWQIYGVSRPVPLPCDSRSAAARKRFPN
jgi:WD40 repeat protein